MLIPNLRYMLTNRLYINHQKCWCCRHPEPRRRCYAKKNFEDLIIDSNSIFKTWALWADAFYKSIYPSVCPSVCVCLFKSRMSNIFRASESLGENNLKKWSQIWIFLLECGLKSANKKIDFLADFALQNRVETTLPDRLETSGQRAYN